MTEMSKNLSQALLQKYRKLLENSERSKSTQSYKDDPNIQQYDAKPIPSRSISAYPKRKDRNSTLSSSYCNKLNEKNNSDIRSDRNDQSQTPRFTNDVNYSSNSVEDTTFGNTSFLIDNGLPAYKKAVSEDYARQTDSNKNNSLWSENKDNDISVDENTINNSGSTRPIIANFTDLENNSDTIAALRREQKKLIETIKRRAAKAIYEAQLSSERCVNELRASLRESVQEKEDLKKQLRELKTQIHIQKTGMDALLRKNLSLHEKFLHEKQCLETQLAEVTAESLGLRKDLDAREEHFAKIKNDVDVLCNERIRVATDIAAARCDSLQQQISKYEQELRESQNEKVVLLKQVSVDMRKLATLAENNKREADYWKSKAEENKRIIALSKVESDNKGSELKMLEKENSQLRERNERLTKELIRTDRMIFGTNKQHSL